MEPEREADADLDLVGLPFLRPSSLIGVMLPQIRSGHLLRVISDDPWVLEEVERWVEGTGQEIAKIEEDGKVQFVYIRRVR